MKRSNILSRNNKVVMTVLSNAATRSVVLNSKGSVAYETSRDSYRGFVTINGARYATKRYPTRLGARRALNRMIGEITSELRIS